VWTGSGPGSAPAPPGGVVACLETTSSGAVRAHRRGASTRGMSCACITRVTYAYAVLNQKGGVGKTTVTVNLAAAAARQGARILVVDADPQASATRALEPDATFTLHDVLENGAERSAADAIVPAADSWGVDIIASELALARRDAEQTVGSEQRLRRALVGVADSYDLVLIDCPPSVGRLVATALVAVDAALLVTEPGRDSVAGLAGVTETVELVRAAYRPDLAVAGVVVNRVERTAEHRRRLAELDELYGDLLWTPTVDKRAAVAESLGAARPVLDWPGSAAQESSAAFAALAARLLDPARTPSAATR